MSKFNAHAKNAILLVAGVGSRLLPFTNSEPKCFATVREKRIIFQTLDNLAASGCSNVRIVIGHHAELIMKSIPKNYRGMDIEFVLNEKYRSTNSMYSLALGLKDINAQTWIIEGDVFFEKKILEKTGQQQINWYVDSTCKHLDGCYVERDSAGFVKGIDIIRDLSLLNKSQAKSIGVLNVTADGVNILNEWLREAIQDNRTNDYYDLILRDKINTVKFEAVDVAGIKWFEIDTLDDLKAANHMFAN